MSISLPWIFGSGFLIGFIGLQLFTLIALLWIAIQIHITTIPELFQPLFVTADTVYSISPVTFSLGIVIGLSIQIFRYVYTDTPIYYDIMNPLH